MTNHCGECNACCRAFNIPELKKPAGKWCEHCVIGKSCEIYPTRPQVCKEFECLWLQSQRRSPNEKLHPELRPDKCKVILSTSTNEKVVAATTLPGAHDAWQRPEVIRIIGNIINNGYAVVCGAALSTERTFIDRYGQRKVKLSEPDENGVQWGQDD